MSRKVDGYTTHATPPIDRDGNKLSEKNSRDTNFIMSGMASLVYVNAMHYDSAKDIWDKLQNVYEGDAKVKGAML
jgi:hypothetical protein